MLIALVALVAAGAVYNALPGTGSPEPTAAKFSEGWCAGNGVTLHVESGESTSTRCAIDFTGTGWEIFAATGTKVEGTLNYPTGFVCRIESMPANQDCKDLPKYSEGSWSYYFAPVGAKAWTFSPTGAALRSPECGSAEAWVFVASNALIANPREKPVTKPCK